FRSGLRRFDRKLGGAFQVLWEDTPMGGNAGTYQVTVAATDTTLRGYVDDVPLFVVDDADPQAGRVGLVCSGIAGRFSDVGGAPAGQAFGDWLLDESFDIEIPGRWAFEEEGDQDGPARWVVEAGELRQTSPIYGETPGAPPDRPGTYALAGDPGWADYRAS